MRLIAHRGMGAKENTMSAFVNTLQNDEVVGFEFDIRKSKDNEMVVIHDPLIDRTTNKSGLVNEYGAEFLRSLGIPLLEEVLGLNTDKILLIEVKDTTIDPRKLTNLLNNSKRRIYLTGFNNEFLRKVLKEKPNFKVGPLDMKRKEKSYKEFDFVSLFSDFVSEEDIKYLHNHNLELFLWGINTKTKKFRDYYSKLEDVYLIVDI